MEPWVFKSSSFENWDIYVHVTYKTISEQYQGNEKCKFYSLFCVYRTFNFKVVNHSVILGIFQLYVYISHSIFNSHISDFNTCIDWVLPNLIIQHVPPPLVTMHCWYIALSWWKMAGNLQVLDVKLDIWNNLYLRSVISPRNGSVLGANTWILISNSLEMNIVRSTSNEQ